MKTLLISQNGARIEIKFETETECKMHYTFLKKLWKKLDPENCEISGYVTIAKISGEWCSVTLL